MVSGLEFALLVYAIVTLLIFVLSRWYFKITTWSSLAVALALGIVILFISFPMSSLYQVRRKKLFVGLYLIIIFVTFLITIAYIVDKASHDKIPYSQQTTFDKDITASFDAPSAKRSMTDAVLF